MSDSLSFLSKSFCSGACADNFRNCSTTSLVALASLSNCSFDFVSDEFATSRSASACSSINRFNRKASRSRSLSSRDCRASASSLNVRTASETCLGALGRAPRSSSFACLDARRAACASLGNCSSKCSCVRKFCSRSTTNCSCCGESWGYFGSGVACTLSCNCCSRLAKSLNPSRAASSRSRCARSLSRAA